MEGNLVVFMLVNSSEKRGHLDLFAQYMIICEE